MLTATGWAATWATATTAWASATWAATATSWVLTWANEQAMMSRFKDGHLADGDDRLLSDLGDHGDDRLGAQSAEAGANVEVMMAMAMATTATWARRRGLGRRPGRRP